MRLVDVGLSMPRIFVLLMVVALWERLPVAALVLLIGLTGWFGTSRLVRAEVLSLREREFVAAARALGAGDRKSTRLNSSHGYISYAVFCLKKKKKKYQMLTKK